MRQQTAILPFSNVTSGKKTHKEVTGAANLTLQLSADTEDQSGAAGQRCIPLSCRLQSKAQAVIVTACLTKHTGAKTGGKQAESQKAGENTLSGFKDSRIVSQQHNNSPGTH